MAPAALAAKSPTAPQQRNRKLQPSLPAALTIAGGALALGCWLVARRRRRAGQQRAKAAKVGDPRIRGARAGGRAGPAGWRGKHGPPARPLPRAGAHDSLLRPPLPQAQAEFTALQAGDVVDLQIPIRPTKAPPLPFLPPKALGTVLADVTLPSVPLSALWRAAFANDAGFLVAFHTARRDHDITLAPWRKTGARRGGRGAPALAAQLLRTRLPLGWQAAHSQAPVQCLSAVPLPATQAVPPWPPAPWSTSPRSPTRWARARRATPRCAAMRFQPFRADTTSACLSLALGAHLQLCG